MTMHEFLDVLSVELAARGVRHELIDGQPEREPGVPPYIAVSDRAGRTRRIHVHLAYFWYYWGSEPGARWSVFRPDIAADVIADRALQTGWPDGPQGDLTLTLRPDVG
jgi:hypothetical protein